MRSMVAVGVVALVLAAPPGFAQTPPPQTPPPAQQPPAQPPAQQVAPPLTFGSDAAILFNTIKADKTADFEAVMAKLKEALQKGNDQRKQQAASWKVFKSVEPVQGNALYLFVVDPPVKDADYTVSKVLAEAFPTEAMDLYKKYSEAYVGGRNLMNLQLIQHFGVAGAPAAAAGADAPTCPTSSHPTAPAGSTAVCNDGTFSSSQNRAGTCSSSGGVKCWLCPGPLCSGF